MSLMIDGRQYFVFRQQVIRGTGLLAVIGAHLWSNEIPFLSFAVPIFIVLSGFQLSLNSRNLRPLPFYRRTLPYLVIPYLLYSAVFALPHIVRGMPPKELWKAFLTSNLEPHLWFMPVIIALYLLHPFLKRLHKRHPMGTWVLAIFLQLWIWPWLKDIGLQPGALRTMLTFNAVVGYFVSGYVLLDNAQRVRHFCESRTGRLFSLFTWCLWPSVMHLVPPDQIPASILQVLKFCSNLGAYCLLAAVSRPQSPPGKMVADWVGCLGLYSYGAYLVHPIVISILSIPVTGLLGFEYWSPAWRVTVFPLTAVLTFNLVRWLARWPLGRYFT